MSLELEPNIPYATSGAGRLNVMMSSANEIRNLQADLIPYCGSGSVVL